MWGGLTSVCVPGAGCVTAFGELLPSSWAHRASLNGAPSPGAACTAEPECRETWQLRENFTTSSTAFGKILINHLYPAPGPVSPGTDWSHWGGNKRKQKCVSVGHWLYFLCFQVVLTPTALAQLWREVLQGQSKVQQQHSCCWHPPLLLHFHHCAAKDLLFQRDRKVQKSRKKSSCKIAGDRVLWSDAHNKPKDSTMDPFPRDQMKTT